MPGDFAKSFSEKLDTLMHVFAISNNRLAAGINVDASLISRWRSGERSIDAKSPHIADIAGYFIRLANMEYQKFALCEITGIDLGSEPTDRKIEYISLWLSGLINLSNRYTNTSDLVKQPGGVTTEKLSTTVMPPVNQATTGRRCEAEVFTGLRGKRDAFMSFLYEVLPAETPLELLFMCEENMSWLFGDKEYFAEWSLLLLRIIAKGCRIKVIYNVNRDLTELIIAIKSSLPMHLSGRIVSYYYPRLYENLQKRSMLIAPGLAAITSTSVGSSNSDIFLFRDSEVVYTFEQDFRTYLKECKELVRLFTAPSPGEYHTISKRFHRQLTDCICYEDCPTDITMPDTLFERLLSATQIAEPIKAKILRDKRAKTADFLKGLRYNIYSEIARLPTLSNLSNGFCPIVMDHPDLTEQIPYDIRALIEHLEYIITLLRNYENFHFIYIKEPLIKSRIPLSLSVKCETGAILRKGDIGKANFSAIHINEPHLTDALYHYLSGYMERLPANRRDKNTAIEAITDYIERIRKL